MPNFINFFWIFQKYFGAIFWNYWKIFAIKITKKKFPESLNFSKFFAYFCRFFRNYLKRKSKNFWNSNNNKILKKIFPESCKNAAHFAYFCRFLAQRLHKKVEKSSFFVGVGALCLFCVYCFLLFCGRKKSGKKKAEKHVCACLRFGAFVEVFYDLHKTFNIFSSRNFKKK